MIILDMRKYVPCFSVDTARVCVFLARPLCFLASPCIPFLSYVHDVDCWRLPLRHLFRQAGSKVARRGCWSQYALSWGGQRSVGRGVTSSHCRLWCPWMQVRVFAFLYSEAWAFNGNLVPSVRDTRFSVTRLGCEKLRGICGLGCACKGITISTTIENALSSVIIFFLACHSFSCPNVIHDT